MLTVSILLFNFSPKTLTSSWISCQFVPEQCHEDGGEAGAEEGLPHAVAQAVALLLGQLRHYLERKSLK